MAQTWQNNVQFSLTCSDVSLCDSLYSKQPTKRKPCQSLKILVGLGAWLHGVLRGTYAFVLVVSSRTFTEGSRHKQQADPIDPIEKPGKTSEKCDS